MVQIGVLSKNREFFPTSQLLKELEYRRNLSGVFISTQYVNPIICNLKSDAIFANQSLKSLAGVIPRIGRTHTEIGIICLKHFKLMDIPTTLSANALFLARDKFKCYQVLKKIPGVVILSPEEEKCRSSMITLRVKNSDNRKICGLLEKKGLRVRSVTEANLDAIRVSFHIYNNKKESERLLEEIKAISRC